MVKPLAGRAMSQFHCAVFGRAAAYRKLPPTQDHRQGKLRQGQAGATHTDRQRGEQRPGTTRTHLTVHGCNGDASELPCTLGWIWKMEENPHPAPPWVNTVGFRSQNRMGPCDSACGRRFKRLFHTVQSTFWLWLLQPNVPHLTVESLSV